jgi:hypothetical protein
VRGGSASGQESSGILIRSVDLRDPPVGGSRHGSNRRVNSFLSALFLWVAKVELCHL